MVAVTGLAMATFYEGNYLLTCINVMLVCWQILNQPHLEATLVRNKGLNVNRMLWLVRTICTMACAWVVGISYIYVPGVTFFDHAENACMLLLIPALYFNACNGLPPGYEERKLVLRPTSA
jgi:hypothetical protein